MNNVIAVPKIDYIELGSAFDVKDYSSEALKWITKIVIKDAEETLGPGKVYELRAKIVGFKSDYGRGPVDEKYGIAWYRTEDKDGSPLLDQYPIFGPCRDLPHINTMDAYYLLGRLSA